MLSSLTCIGIAVGRSVEEHDVISKANLRWRPFFLLLLCKEMKKSTVMTMMILMMIGLSARECSTSLRISILTTTITILIINSNNINNGRFERFEMSQTGIVCACKTLALVVFEGHILSAEICLQHLPNVRISNMTCAIILDGNQILVHFMLKFQTQRSAQAKSKDRELLY